MFHNWLKASKKWAWEATLISDVGQHVTHESTYMYIYIYILHTHMDMKEVSDEISRTQFIPGISA